MLVVIGDSLGRSHKFDLTPVAVRCSLTPIAVRRKVKFFEFKRREHQVFVLTALYEPPLKAKTYISKLNWIVQTVQAHSNPINHIVSIAKLNAFCSCSEDSTVKIFQCGTGEQICGINLRTLRIDMWKLPQRVWIQERLEEFLVVLAISEELTGRRMNADEIDKAQAKFLMNLFLTRQQKVSFVRELRADEPTMPLEAVLKSAKPKTNSIVGGQTLR